MAIKDGDVVDGNVIDLRVDKQHRTVISTILLLPKSRRILIAVVAFLVAGFVNMIPALEPFREYIGQLFTMAILVILGISGEDVVTAAGRIWNNNKDANIEEEVTGIIESILSDALGGGSNDDILEATAQGNESSTSGT